jgi:hypothetical protein
MPWRKRKSLATAELQTAIIHPMEDKTLLTLLEIEP